MGRRFTSVACSLFLLQLLILQLVAISATHSTPKHGQGFWEHSTTHEVLAKNDVDVFSGKGGDKVGGRKMGAENKVGVGVELRKKKQSGEDEAGFVAFNEDYHAPRHHPPKNN